MAHRRYIEGTGAVEHQPIDWVDRVIGLIVSGLAVASAGYGVVILSGMLSQA